MDKVTKIWLITAASLVLLGCIILGGSLAMSKWDFKSFSTTKYETNTHEITEDFQSISINIDTTDVTFAVTDGSKCSVVCYEQKNLTHAVSVKDGVLIIELIDSRKWYEHIVIGFETPSITFYLPRGEYDALSVSAHTGDIEIPADFAFRSIDITTSTGEVKNYASALESVKIKATTGNITVEGLSSDSLELSVSTGIIKASDVTCNGNVTVRVSTGEAYLNNVTCGNISSTGNTGDIFLKNVMANEKLSIERSTGNVKLERCDAAEIFIKTDTGDVKGTLLSDKVFIVRTDTGRISVPDTVTGGRCEITTDTGNINVSIQK